MWGSHTQHQQLPLRMSGMPHPSGMPLKRNKDVVRETTYKGRGTLLPRNRSRGGAIVVKVMLPCLCAAAGRLDGVVPVSGGVENGVPHMTGIATLHAVGCPVASAHAFDSAAAASVTHVSCPNTVPFAAPRRESQPLFPNDPGADRFSTGLQCPFLRAVPCSPGVIR